MAETLGHVFPGVFFVTLALVVFLREPTSRSRLILGGLNKLAFVAIIACLGGSYKYLTSVEMWIHRLHHTVMFTSFAIVMLFDVADSKGWCFEGAGSLALSAAFFSEAVLFSAHTAKTMLETRSHLFLMATAIVAGAASMRWALDPLAQWARTALLYATALHGLLFIQTGIWLGYAFTYTAYRERATGLLYVHPHAGSYPVSMIAFGPFFNHTEDVGGVWKSDMTSGADLMQLHVLVCGNALLLAFVGMLRMNCVYRKSPPTQSVECGESASIIGNVQCDL